MHSDSGREDFPSLPPGFPSNELPLLSSIFYKNLSSPSDSRKEARQEDSQGSAESSRENTFVRETSLLLKTSTAGSLLREDSGAYHSSKDAGQNEPGSTRQHFRQRHLQEGSRPSLHEERTNSESSRMKKTHLHFSGRDLLAPGEGSGLVKGRETMLHSDHSSSVSEADSTDAAIRLAESSLLEALERRKASSLGVGPALLEDIERPFGLQDSQLPSTPLPLHAPLEAELERLSSALAARDDELQTARKELDQLRRVSEAYLSPYEVQKREEAALRREAELLQTLNGVEEDLTKAQAEVNEERAQRVSLESATSQLQLEVTEFLDTELAVAQHLRERAELKAEAERQKRKKLEEKIRGRKAKRESIRKEDGLTLESSYSKVPAFPSEEEMKGDDSEEKRKGAERKGGHVLEAGMEENLALAQTVAQPERSELLGQHNEVQGGEESKAEDVIVAPEVVLEGSQEKTVVEAVEERVVGQSGEASPGNESVDIGEEATATAEGSSRSADPDTLGEATTGVNEKFLGSLSEKEELKRELEREREARTVAETRVSLLLEHRAAMDNLVRSLSGTLLEKLAEVETLNRRLEREMNGSSGSHDGPAFDIVAALASRSGGRFAFTKGAQKSPSASALDLVLDGERLNQTRFEVDDGRESNSVGLQIDGRGNDKAHSSEAQVQGSSKETAMGDHSEESQVQLNTKSALGTVGEEAVACNGGVMQAAARVGDEEMVERGPSTAGEQTEPHNTKETGNRNQATGEASISPNTQGGKRSRLLDANDKHWQDKGPPKEEPGKATRKQGSKARVAKTRGVENLTAAKKSKPPWTNRNARSVLPERQQSREAYQSQVYDEKSRARNLNLRSVLMVKCRRCSKRVDLNDLDDRTCGSHPGFLGPLGYTCCGNLPTRPGRKVDFCSWQHHVA